MKRVCGLVDSADGTEIFFVDYAQGADSAKPTFLLVHGWSASSQSWGDQLITALIDAGHRVVAVDNRGHGRSSVPISEQPYSTERFASDLTAVREQLSLGDVILVGWSYGGLVIADHLSVAGTGGVRAVALVGAITSIGGDASGPFPGGAIGSGMQAALPGALSARPGKAIAALAQLRMLPHGFDQDTLGPVAQEQFGIALSTPPAVRGGLFRRTVYHDDDLRAWTFPVLIQHGRDDEVVAPSSAQHHADVLPNATLSWWDGGGHAPFVVDPARAARELLELAGIAS